MGNSNIRSSKEIGLYKDHIDLQDMALVQNQCFNKNYDAWDEGYFSEDTTNLIGKDNDIN